MQFGSQVYGTSTPESDTDYKGIFVPDPRDILLQRATKVSTNTSTGDPLGKNEPGDVDRENFSLHGYLKLLCEGQTIAVDMLFVPERFYMGEFHPLWWRIRENREKLLSSQVTAFVGYCKSQANKYGIKGSRMKAAHEAALLMARLGSRPPHGLRARLEEHRDELVAFVKETEHVCFEFRTIRSESTDHEIEHLSVCGKLAPLTAPLQQARDMYTGLWHRYGDRARAAANNEGIDWKALMHAVRILHQAQELLAAGHVTFPRPEAEELLAIRLGQRDYNAVAREIEEGIDGLDALVESSRLRSEPDRGFAEDLVVHAYWAECLGEPRCS